MTINDYLINMPQRTEYIPATNLVGKDFKFKGGFFSDFKGWIGCKVKALSTPRTSGRNIGFFKDFLTVF